MGWGLTQYIPYVIYVSGFIAAYLSVFVNPLTGILFLFPIFPYQIIFERFQLMPLGKDLNDIILISIIFGWLIRKINFKGRIDLRRAFAFEKTAMNKPVLLFVLLSLFGLLMSIYNFGLSFGVGNIFAGVTEWKNYMVLPLIWFLTVNIVKTRRQLALLTLILIIGICGVDYYFFSNLKWMNIWHYSDKARDMMTGIFVYLGANHYGAFFVHFIFILIGIMLFSSSKIKKTILLGLVYLTAYCLVYTFSRGAYLAFLVALLFIGIVKDKRILLLLFIFILVWRSLVPIAVTERIDMTRNDYGELDASAAQRVQLWNIAWGMFKSSPIIGNGLYSFSLYTSWDTHNMYLKILAESGVVGLAVLLYFLYASFMSGWNLFRKAKDNFFKGLGLGFAACVISLAITNYFGDRWSYLSLGSYFWIFLGIINRASIINKAELHSKSRPK